MKAWGFSPQAPTEMQGYTVFSSEAAHQADGTAPGQTLENPLPKPCASDRMPEQMKNDASALFFNNTFRCRYSLSHGNY